MVKSWYITSKTLLGIGALIGTAAITIALIKHCSKTKRMPQYLKEQVNTKILNFKTVFDYFNHYSSHYTVYCTRSIYLPLSKSFIYLKNLMVALLVLYSIGRVGL